MCCMNAVAKYNVWGAACVRDSRLVRRTKPEPISSLTPAGEPVIVHPVLGRGQAHMHAHGNVTEK